MAVTERDLLYRAKFQDDVTPAHEDMISRAVASSDRMGSAERAWNDEIKQVRSSILEQRDALVLRKEALDDPAMQRAIMESRMLQGEIQQLTKATMVDTEADHLNARSKQQLIVAGRELAMGRTNRLPGTLAVLAEQNGGLVGALKSAVTMMGGPYVVAAGLAVVATVGVGVAMWKASEAAAENWHQMKLLGEELGVSGQDMLGFQYMTQGTGVSVDHLATTFGILEKNLGKNPEKFRELGITAHEPMDAFEQIADKVSGMSNAMDRAAFVTELLGRGGEKLIPVLMEGGDAAKRAIEAMKIPDDVKSDFDKTISDQIEIDKNWMVMKQNSGEYFAGLRRAFKDMEADAATLGANHGFMAALGAFTPVGRAFAEQENAPNPTDRKGGASTGPAPMSEEQKKALEEAQKALGKDSLAIAIQNIKDEWKGRLEEFAVGSDNYKTVLRAELQAEDDIRKSFAKKGRTHSKEDRTPGEADSQFEKATGISYGAYSMAHPGGTEADVAGQGSSVTKDEQGNEAKAQAKMMADLTKSQEEKSRLEQREVDQFAKWEAEKTRIAQEEAKRRQEAQQKYFDAAQKGMEQQILLMEQGKFSAKELDAVFENMAEQAVARLISETVVSLAQSVIMGTAWAVPAMLASIATSGGADAAGSTAYEAAMMQAQFSGGHAVGGTQFGGMAMVGERGPELSLAAVPRQIFQTSHTTNNNNGGNTVHVHIHGGDQATILRTIRNATTNSSGGSH
jgi:hypothetical protein